MINTSLLCEFVINPFGNEQKAREFLAEIEERELSAIEFARGEFCFQVAFYFLALRAVDAVFVGSSVRNAFLCQLQKRVRGFYAHAAASPVSLAELTLSSAERDLIEAALRRMPCAPAPADAACKLVLFDLVGMPRLAQYRQLVGADFGALAQLLLLHYSGRPYHPVVIEVVADLLATNYIIACKIVGSSLEEIDARQSERETTLSPLPLRAGMPDLVGRQPNRAWRARDYVVLLFEDVTPIGGRAGLSFKYVLALCDGATRLPLCLVTLENSRSLANILCVFEESGGHSNYGSLHGHGLREFTDQALILLRDRFDLHEFDTFGTAIAGACSVNDIRRSFPKILSGGGLATWGRALPFHNGQQAALAPRTNMVPFRPLENSAG